MADTLPEETLDVALSLGRIRRILDSSHTTAERAYAIEALLPSLWHPMPWVRYTARCHLTTRLYLPYGLHLLEWVSFPHAFGRELRRHEHRMTEERPESRREAVAATLCAMLRTWSARQRGVDVTPEERLERQRSGVPPPSLPPPSKDLGADICEAIGRMGIYEAEEELVTLLYVFGKNESNEVRTEVLRALAALPPPRLTLVWSKLQTDSKVRREIMAAILYYVSNPDSLPFLLEALACQSAEHMVSVVRPLLLALGNIGDPRALPALNAIARNEAHPERATAKLAIQRLMKQAAGLEEVTLLRGSSVDTLNEDMLLRAAYEKQENISEELLRPTSMETATDRTEAS